MGNAIAEKCNKDKLKDESTIHLCRTYIGGAFIGFSELLIGIIMIVIIVIYWKNADAFKYVTGKEGSRFGVYFLLFFLIFAGAWLSGISFAGQNYLPQTSTP
jgi:hypothetical protein